LPAPVRFPVRIGLRVEFTDKMSDGMNNRDLLPAFARQQSEAASRELVRRRAKLVYSCARQRVGDTHAARQRVKNQIKGLATVLKVAAAACLRGSFWA
jgi:hypothetical protein